MRYDMFPICNVLAQGPQAALALGQGLKNKNKFKYEK